MAVQTLRGLTLANGPSDGPELECQAVDYDEIVGGQGNNNGAYVNCCGPGAFNPSSWTYCECNRGGDYTGVFNESGVKYSNVYTVNVPDTSAAIPFAQMQSENRERTSGPLRSDLEPSRERGSLHDHRRHGGRRGGR